MLSEHPDENGWKQEEGHWIYTNNDLDETGFGTQCWSEEKGWYTVDGETGEETEQDAWVFRFKDLQPRFQRDIRRDSSMLERGQEHLDLYPELAEQKLPETEAAAEQALAEQYAAEDAMELGIMSAFEAGNGGNSVDNLFKATASSGGGAAPSTYAVTFVTEHGTAPAAQHVAPGGYAAQPNPINAPGYTFVAWLNGANIFDFANTAIEAPLTLTASWNENHYNIDFDSNGGTGTNASLTDIAYTARPVITAGATLTGYTLAGWSPTQIAAGGDISSITTLIAPGDPIPDALSSDDGDTVTLYAVWSPISYYVNYNANAANYSGTMDPSEFAYDVESNLTANSFTNRGYDFTGWNTMSDGTGTTYTDGQAVLNLSGDPTTPFELYAQWALQVYNISYDKNDENAVAIQAIAPQTLTIQNTEVKAVNGNDYYSYPTDSSIYGWAVGTPDSTTVIKCGDNLADYFDEISAAADTGYNVTMYAVWKEFVLIRFDADYGYTGLQPVMAIIEDDAVARKIEFNFANALKIAEYYVYKDAGTVTFSIQDVGTQYYMAVPQAGTYTMVPLDYGKLTVSTDVSSTYNFMDMPVSYALVTISYPTGIELTDITGYYFNTNVNDDTTEVYCPMNDVGETTTDIAFKVNNSTSNPVTVFNGDVEVLPDANGVYTINAPTDGRIISILF